jgi:hypothetical protein
VRLAVRHKAGGDLRGKKGSSDIGELPRTNYRQVNGTSEEETK